MGTVLDGRWWCDGVAVGGRVVVTVVGDPEGQSRTYMTTTPARSSNAGRMGKRTRLGSHWTVARAGRETEWP